MLFQAEDTSNADYRSLFEYAAGDEARLAQDRRLAYYQKVLPKMLPRVKDLPLMYQTYSKRWKPDTNKPAFIVKRLVPNEKDDKIDIKMNSDQDITDFMTRKGRFKGHHGFNKGFAYLAPIYHVERDQMPFIQVDLDIEGANFNPQAWNKLIRAVIKVYDWFRVRDFDTLINFTGSSFHIWAKDGKMRSYKQIKSMLGELSQDVDLPLAAGAAHVKGQITIDYPQNKYRAPLRFPLSLHGDTGLVSVIVPRNQLTRFDPKVDAHPDKVLANLSNHLKKIDKWFSNLDEIESRLPAEQIINDYLATLNEQEIENCIWGECGLLADRLMVLLQDAGYDSAVYEIGRAYIHGFEDYDNKTFIGGHVVITIDGVSYDALGAGAKQRWEDSSVLVDILSQHGYDELGPLLSAHLTVDWITSTWDEVQQTRRHNFAGNLVEFEGEQLLLNQTWYSSSTVHPWSRFLDTECWERDNYRYEDMKALESKYNLTDDSAVIWVSALPEVAASYMIGQGLRDNRDEEVKEDYGFSKADLKTTTFGQIYYPPHVEYVDDYQGTIIPETDDGDGGYLLNLHRDFTGRRRRAEEVTLLPYTPEFGGLFTEVLFKGYDEPLGDKNLPALMISYRLRYWPELPQFQPWGGEVRELHLSLHPDYQGLGLAAKMIRTTLLNETEEVMDEDIPFWLAYARIINPHVFGVIRKLQQDPLLEISEVIGSEGDAIGVVISLSNLGEKVHSTWEMDDWREYTSMQHIIDDVLEDEEFEGEYKQKRKKPTPEPDVEGSGKLKPTRRKPPMKVKGSDVYSVQKHQAEKRGSHRDIRIGLDGTLLSFVPVGKGFGKSRFPKKIGEGISVIRTENHPFDYWWFEGEIPKGSYGAGPVSLETHGTRRIIEWIPDKKLKVEFIGGKYAGTYTFSKGKKPKVWWMRKSRYVPEEKEKKAESKDDKTDSEILAAYNQLSKGMKRYYGWGDSKIYSLFDTKAAETVGKIISPRENIGNVGLIKGRHEMPVTQYVFETIGQGRLDTLIPDLSKQAREWIRGPGAELDRINLYVVGFTPALTAFLVEWNQNNSLAELYLMHFDSSNDEYVSQLYQAEGI